MIINKTSGNTRKDLTLKGFNFLDKFPLLLFFIIILLAIPLGKTEVMQQMTDGFIIVDSQNQILKQNQDYNYNFLVMNISKGVLNTNLTSSCNFYLLNSSGNLLLNYSANYLSQGYWNVVISKGNISQSGTYNYITKCNSSILSGSTIGKFEVTPTGFIGTIGFYIIFIILSFGLVILGISKGDITITILGSFGLYFVGLYALFYGLDGQKNLYSEAIALIVLFLAAYISVRTGMETFSED